MKGKVHNYKIVLAFMIALLAVVCFYFAPTEKIVKNKVYASTKVELGGEEFSALFDGGVIFSAEKVGVNAEEDANKNPNSLTVDHKTFKGVNQNYDFVDINNGAISKTVVDNAGFVMLNNKIQDGKYVSHNSSAFQEAVMISFGSYIYDSQKEEISIADAEGTNAGITWLKVTLQRSEDPNAPEIPLAYRNITTDVGLRFDFTYLITQQEDNSNEGCYIFNFTYMIGDVDYSQSFKFYLTNETSYTQTHVVDDVTYNAFPTLGWSEDTNFAKTEKENGYVRYSIGENGINNNVISYPTITYDYVRYKLWYVHTVNGRNTTYTFAVDTSKNSSGTTTAELVYTISNIEGNTVKRQQLLDYNEDSSINLLSIMLTEPGTYTINYEYLYLTDNIAEVTMPIPTEEIKLSIHGMSVEYSKNNFESARMQYFEIANQQNNKVDLFIPQGHEVSADLSEYYEKSLGFVYKLIDNKNREGSILTSDSKDALINHILKNTKTKGENTDYDFLISAEVLKALEDITTSNIKSDINAVVANIKYAETNQGSLWIKGNDAYNTDSFYFYSPAKDTILEHAVVDDKGTKDDTTDDTTTYVSNYKKFTNVTSFNKQGYYLVFIKVEESGNIKDEEQQTYWQIFAFRYSSDSVDVEITTSDDNILKFGKFTNKDVKVSWENPGVFDRAIKASYYYVLNNNYSREEMLSKTAENNIEDNLINIVANKSYITLGNEIAKVENGNYATFLIRLKSEGEAVAHKMFIIDRQAISGVQAYLVEEITTGNYAYATNSDGYEKPVLNSITDSYATISWNEKASGANVYASYSYTSFTANNEDVSKVNINVQKNEVWFLTNYELGKTSNGIPFEKASSKYSMTDDSVLDDQGIYIMHIWDDAGNECYYAFVIDKTKNYIEINGSEFISNEAVIYGTDVNYDVGSHKAFALDVEDIDDKLSDEVEDFIILAADKNLNSYNKYYNGSDNNINQISEYFKEISGSYYFVIPNKKVVIYDGSLPENNNAPIKGTILNNSDDEGSSYIRTLYVISENHKNSTLKTTDLSYATIEINTDNSRGFVYYSNDDIENVPSNGEWSSGLMHRLTTGKTINKAYATSAKNLVFTWLMGSNNFEVESITYDYYELYPNTYNNNELYFYNNKQTYTIYNGDPNSSAIEINGARSFFRFNTYNDCKEGLYIVTRTYKSDANLGDDDQVRSYYFIVDRKNIITDGVGGSIAIKLMEGENEFADFNSMYGTDTELLNNIQNNIYNKEYNIYLETNKLPAEIKVPIGKYFDGEHTSADYFAGKLNIQVYFNDIYGQTINQFKNNSTKIYDSMAIFNDVKYNYKVENGFFVVDIYDYLSNISDVLRDRLTESKTNGTWLFLSGDYVIRITDNVEEYVGTVKTTHETYIGLRITGYQNNGPQIDIFSDYKDTSMSEIISISNGYNELKENFEYTATVSQEFLEVEIPKYNNTFNAEIDNTYLVVEEFYGENDIFSEYINHPYIAINGISLKENNDYIKINADGSFRVVLNTRLKQNGIINPETFNIPLYYTIKVRYKLNYTTDNNERYKNCYVYYENDKIIRYFEALYTIRIDREAPTNNIKHLNENDVLVQSYNDKFGTVEMFENGIHETTAKLHFTKQYAKYYQTEMANNEYIYVYQVNAATPFDKTDIDKVYFKKIIINKLSDLASYDLTLPFINTSNYDGVIKDVQSIDFVGYSGLLGTRLTNNNYYEIVEVDHAGNVTQYVIHYNPEIAFIEIPVQLKKTIGGVVDVDITFKPEDLNIFNIKANGEVLVENDYFFKIELQKTTGEIIGTILTDVTTDLTKLSENIVAMFTEQGNYNLVITSKTINNVVQINLYSEENFTPLNIENLVVGSVQNGYVINFSNANNIQNNMLVFATEIIVKYGNVETKYIGRIENNEVKYFIDDEEIYALTCLADTTYKITMTDSLGNVTLFRFNTAGQAFYVLTFDSGDYYQVGTEQYYGYTSATLTYSTLFKAKYFEKESGNWVEKTDKIIDLGNNYKQFRMNALENNLFEVRIDLYEGDIFERTYYVTIDTYMGSVALRDYSSGELRDIISIFNNMEYDDDSLKVTTRGSGILNLHWQETYNDYFDYTYTLYELMKDGSYKEYDLNDVTNFVVSTTSESKGVYKFITSVWSKDGKYLGNRVYVFEVQEVSSELYYVRTEDGVAIAANSSFKITDFVQADGFNAIAEAVKNRFGEQKLNAIQNINIPLYISNKDLDVVLTDNKLITLTSSEIITGIFNLYEIEKQDAFKIYFATLFIEETENVIKNVYVKEEKVTDKTSLIIADNELTAVDVKIETLTNELNSKLFAKNIVLADIYHNNKLVKTVEFNRDLTLLGNGEYSITFKDLAGNVHKFSNGSKQLSIFILKEVPVLVNGQTPIVDAYYNEAVELNIYASAIYEKGSITVNATKNGLPYKYEGINPYTFSEYGTYRVNISVDYNNNDEIIKLNKVVTFTIINEKEATTSIDLSNLKSSKITSITNKNNEDVTAGFMEMLNSKKGMMVSYENLMEYSNKLKISSGKLTFTINYTINDGIYAERSSAFTFTLNNEQPKIECSIKPGETTTKGFRIRFNPSIIYEQIGESYVYINGDVVEHITEASANKERSIYTSFKSKGDGDYYVKLVSSSGRIVDSFKVTIKEPLNAGAIIIIIVAVAVVATVVTTIIVLRRKMRIR